MVIFLIIPLFNIINQLYSFQTKPIIEAPQEKKYWLMLLRKSNIEKLYQGIPGDENKSQLIKTFKVKTGIPGKRPTPLPQLLGRQYWIITDKFDASEYPETAPYFLKLDVPVTDEYPYGPQPYEECLGGQCNWELPGYFGLHGINNDMTRLSPENEGSSGCIRHSDEDIIYLYNLINPKDNVRYYIKDI
ncbi:MAG: L,D-transpeptidase [Patescibacteria group bacterium]